MHSPSPAWGPAAMVLWTMLEVEAQGREVGHPLVHPGACRDRLV